MTDGALDVFWIHEGLSVPSDLLSLPRFIRATDAFPCYRSELVHAHALSLLRFMEISIALPFIAAAIQGALPTLAEIELSTDVVPT